MKQLLLLTLTLAGLAACSSPASEIALTKSDNGKTISAAPNQLITITLDSNATTGFKWNLTGEPDAKVLKLVVSKYNAPQNTGGLVGVGGTETWQFQAVGAGTGTLKLAYFRPFDPTQAAGEFTLTVNVK
jgi:inhibitor of cysteine peptidase